MARHTEPTLRDRLEYLGLASVLAAFRRASPARSLAMGRSLGRMVARIGLRREVALANLAQVFPERTAAEHRAIYSAMMEQLGMVLAEFARFEGGNDPVVPFRVGNLDGVRARLAEGRGVILLTGHFGNWEAFAAQLVREGIPMNVLGGRQRNPAVEELINRYRRGAGMRPLVVGQSLRPIVAALAAGSCVASLMDQDGGRNGFFLPFLGRVASVQPGLFRLAVRRSVPVMSGFPVWDGSGWTARFRDPIRIEPASTPEAVDIEARKLARAYLDDLEEHIRAHPEHWFWVHRRWKTRPPGEDST